MGDWSDEATSRRSGATWSCRSPSQVVETTDLRGRLTSPPMMPRLSSVWVISTSPRALCSQSSTARPSKQPAFPFVRSKRPAREKCWLPRWSRERSICYRSTLGTASGHFGDGDGAPTIELFRSSLEARGLTALEPSQAQNTNVFVVLAEAGLGPSISDLSDVASTLRFGGRLSAPTVLCASAGSRRHTVFSSQSSSPNRLSKSRARRFAETRSKSG